MTDCSIPWSRWCRLCANENISKKLLLHFEGRDGYQEPDFDGETHTLDRALEIYFYVKSKEATPRFICEDCHNRIQDIMLYQERVVQVQLMYRFLLRNPNKDTRKLQAIRSSFGVGLEHLAPRCSSACEEHGTVDFSISTKNGGGRFPVDIQQEHLTSASEHIEFEVNNNNEQHMLEQREYVASESEYFSDEMPESLKWEDDDEEEIDNCDVEKTWNHENKVDESEQIIRELPITPGLALEVTCLLCKDKFGHISDYCEHITASHSNANQRSYCPLCSRFFRTTYLLARHIRTHRPMEFRFPFKCTECEKRFTKNDLLDDHILRKHSKEQRFSCHICDYSGLKEQALKLHMIIHNEAMYECQVCKKKFRKLRRLNFHIQTHGHKKYECTVCGKKLNSKATFKEHCQVHSEKKDNKCDHCGLLLRNTCFCMQG